VKLEQILFTATQILDDHLNFREVTQQQTINIGSSSLTCWCLWDLW